MAVLDGGHRLVDQLADGRLLGVGLEMRPARLLRHPEHVLGQILVRVLGGGGILGQQRRALGLEGVRDVLEEDQAERDVLVVGRLQVLAQLVGGQEQLRLEAEIGAVAILSRRSSILRFLCFSAGHLFSSPPLSTFWACPRLHTLLMICAARMPRTAALGRRSSSLLMRQFTVCSEWAGPRSDAANRS